MTKLYAVVDKDDRIIDSSSVMENAWFNAYNTSGAIITETLAEYKNMCIAEGYRCIELHTYDPATHGVYEKATQVVVDRDVYDDVCVTLKYRRPAKTVFQDSVLASVNKFLSAGKG